MPSTLPCALTRKLPRLLSAREKASRQLPGHNPAGGCWDLSPVMGLEAKKGDGKETGMGQSFWGGINRGLVKHLPHRELISSGGDEGSVSTGYGGCFYWNLGAQGAQLHL